MTEQTFRLPDLGEGLIEATVLDWLVAEGDQVSEGQPIVEVETTKSAVEIPAGFTGTISALHAAVADVVAVGEPLFSYSEDGAGVVEGGIVGTVPQQPTHTQRRVRLRPPEDE